MPDYDSDRLGPDGTVRQRLQAELEKETLDCRELSQRLHQSEKEILEHLDHLRLSLRQQAKRLKIEPAVCRRCGFSFDDRSRLTKPGKCPKCRHTGIEPPLFYIAGR